MRILRILYSLKMLLILSLISITCTTNMDNVPGAIHITSSLKYDSSPEVAEEKIKELIYSNNEFAIDLYKELKDNRDNLFISPFSLSQVLAMTWAGADGDTEKQMAETLHFTGSEPSNIHQVFNKVNLELSNQKGVLLENTNSIWAQQDYKWHDNFLDLLMVNYNSGLYTTDFVADPGAAVDSMNAWVMKRTKGKFNAAIKRNTISKLTRIALLNVLYFDGRWEHKFVKSKTKHEPFKLLDGKTVQVPMMTQVETKYKVARVENCNAVELPYKKSDLAMLVLLPELEDFETFEAELSADSLQEIIDKLSPNKINLHFPRIEMESDIDLTKTLMTLGMNNAFEPGSADFSKMTDSDSLFVSHVIQKTYVLINEQGTKAIAFSRTSLALSLPSRIRLDHPFIFLIRDTKTNTILFMGRVVDPSKLAVE